MRIGRGAGIFGIVVVGVVVGWIGLARGQDRLKAVPGYARYEAIGRDLPTAVKSGAVVVEWKDGGRAFEFARDGKAYRFDVATKQATPIPGSGPEAAQRGRNRIGRGRQAEAAPSPDGKLKAIYRDRNLFVTDPDGGHEIAITTDGDEKARTKNGKASWVYGEELAQATAFWWSPDSKKLAYYRFDEAKVADYFLPGDQTKLQDRVLVEPYPKAGTANPVVDLFVHDLASRQATRLDIRDGQPFADATVGYYAYNVRWSADGKILLFFRTNRRQNVLEFVAADPETGRCRVVVREEWPASWVEINPELRFLADGQRFVWATQRSGFKNYELRDLGGSLIAPLTRNEFDANRISRVDEAAGTLDYMAHDGDNPIKLQLHRVRLDGQGDRRLTDPALHHDVDLAPDGAHFVDVAQTHDVPASSRLVDAEGRIVATLADSDLTKFTALGLKRPEMFTFAAADGKTVLHGLLYRPTHFDPAVKYPLLVSVYAGPESNGVTETFPRPRTGPMNDTFGRVAPIAELGFLVVTLDTRGALGRGKRPLDAVNNKLGQTEIDDLAAGVRSLRERPYLDGSKVGVYGTSYGGYASIACLIRHPDTFQAACASSAVTDFRHYDTIYTERYMDTPQANKAGYELASAVLHAGDLKGRLMLYYGTLDNNVHPSNTLQLIQALQAAGKSFDVQIGPDLGHSAISRDRMMEFFVEALKVGKEGSH